MGHGDEIRNCLLLDAPLDNAGCFAIGKKGSILCAGGRDGIIAVWDLENKKRKPDLFNSDKAKDYWKKVDIANAILVLSGEVRVAPDIVEFVRSIAVSPDGRYMASAGDGGNVRLFDLDKHVLLHSLAIDAGDTRCVAFSPDGKTLAAGINSDVQLFDVPGGKRLRTLGGHKETVACLSYSTNGEHLASGGFDHHLNVWDTREFKKRIAIGHTETISSVSFSPDGETLASGAWDNSVRLWHVASLQEIAAPGHHGQQACEFFVGRTYACYSRRNGIRLRRSVAVENEKVANSE